MVFGTRVSAMRVVPALSEAEYKSAMERAEAQFKNRGIFTSKKKRQIKYCKLISYETKKYLSIVLNTMLKMNLFEFVVKRIQRDIK